MSRDRHKRKHKKSLAHTLNCNETLNKYKGVCRGNATQNKSSHTSQSYFTKNMKKRKKNEMKMRKSVCETQTHTHTYARFEITHLTQKLESTNAVSKNATINSFVFYTKHSIGICTTKKKKLFVALGICTEISLHDRMPCKRILQHGTHSEDNVNEFA